MSAVSYFHVLPREISSKIFSYLPLRSIIRSFARSSKSAANFVQEILSDGLAAPNSLNILVTGLPGAGSTTLYSRLKSELDPHSHIRQLSESNEIATQPLKLVDDNWYQICGIQLENIRANIWHGSTKKDYAAMMYAHCGTCQVILYMVPCGDIEQWKARIQQDLITYFALTINVEWIFVINKMDQVQHQEQEYNKCVEVIKNLAVKVFGRKRLNLLHFVPMTVNDVSVPMKRYTNAHMTWFNYGESSLWTTLNNVASERGHPKYSHLFKKLHATIVQKYTKLSTPNTRVLGVYILDGCVSIGDKIQIYPFGFNKITTLSYTPEPSNVEVIEIQSNHSSRTMALPNSYVTLALRLQWLHPIKKFHIVRYPEIKGTYRSNNGPDKYFLASLLHVGDIVPEYKWKGQISKGYTGAIHSLGIRGSVNVVRILSIWKDGKSLDLKAVQEERKCIAIRKGERAEVILERPNPVSTLNITKRSYYQQYSDTVHSRFVILNQKSHVVAVGSVTRGFAYNDCDYDQYKY